MATSKLLLCVTDTLKLVTVEPYLFLCLFGYIVRLVSFQSLLMDSACRNLHLYSDEICDALDDHKHQQERSIETGNNLYSGVMLISCLPSVVVAIFMGPWSDRYGRKIPLMIAASGMMLEAVVTAGLSFYPRVSPVWYVVAGVFTGFSGGLIMSQSVTFSYMADVTDERSRPARYAVLEFADLSAVVLGSVLGGEIFKAGGYVPIMTLSSCSFALAILYTACVVKETRPRTEGQTCSVVMRDLVTVRNIQASYQTCSRKRPGNIRLQIWLLVWASCSQKFVDMGTNAIGFPFARFMYKWTVTDFSQASTASWVVTAIVTVAVVPLLSNKLQIHEAALGLVGMLSLTAKMILTSVAQYPFLFYYAWMGGALNNCASIAIRSRLSKLVNKDELGRVFSLLATCESVTPLLGTLIFVQIYNASFNVFPGLPFAASAIFLIPCLVIFSWMIDLPTVSLADYGRDENTNARPLETLSSNYMTLQEDKM